MAKTDYRVFSAQDIRELLEGSESGWASFFGAFDPLISSVVAWPKWHFDAHVQEDVAQSVRTEITKSISRVKQESSVPYFVKKVCIHRCIDEVRRQVRQRGVFSPMSGTNRHGDDYEQQYADPRNCEPVEEIVRAERASALRELIGELDSNCSDAIRMFYLEHLSYKEIAEKRGITVNTVGSRLSKCLEKLRKKVLQNPVLREENPIEFDSTGERK